MLSSKRHSGAKAYTTRGKGSHHTWLWLTPHVAKAYTTRGVWQNNTSSFSSFPFEVVEMKVPAENNFMARPKLLLALLGESKENL